MLGNAQTEKEYLMLYMLIALAGVLSGLVSMLSG